MSRFWGGVHQSGDDRQFLASWDFVCSIPFLNNGLQQKNTTLCFKNNLLCNTTKEKQDNYSVL